MNEKELGKFIISHYRKHIGHPIETFLRVFLPKELMAKFEINHVTVKKSRELPVDLNEKNLLAKTKRDYSKRGRKRKNA